MHFGTYIYVPKCGFILQRVPQDSNFSHGFLKTVTSPKHYKNQWFLIIISSFLHPCLFFCLTSPKHYKNQWFLLIISSFLHPYLPPFVHSFTPSSLPLLLSLSLPASLLSSFLPPSPPPSRISRNTRNRHISPALLISALKCPSQTQTLSPLLRPTQKSPSQTPHQPSDL